MKILVTGGGGFLGQAVTRALLARGHELTTLNRSDYPALETLGVSCVHGDIGSAGAVEDACSGQDAVVHVAAKAGPGLYRPDFVRANTIGTRNVIEACRKHGVGFLVHTSSPSVVHAGRDIEGGDESLPYPDHFPAPYPATKAESERDVLAANGPMLKTTALRPHLIWGPGDNHLLPRLVERNRAGRLRLPAPERMIDTVYIDNAAEAHCLALENLVGSATAAGRAYFITNDEPLPVGDIIRRLLVAAGEAPRIGSVAPAIARAAGWIVEGAWRGLRLRSDPPISRFVVEHLSTSHWFSIEAARRDLGYQPSVSIDDGMQCLARDWPRDWPRDRTRRPG